MRIAYLVGEYPRVSHAFIRREVEGLRDRGVGVSTFSIRAAPTGELLTAADRQAAAETWTVLPPQWGALAAAHMRASARSPLRYGSTLALALRLSSGGLRAGLWQLFYFVEAIVLWDRLRSQQIKHVHAHFANVATAVSLLVAHFGGEGWSWSFTMHGPTEFDDVTRYALAEKVRRARFVACIGDYCRSQLMKLVEAEQWAKLEIVHCGIDPSAYEVSDRDHSSGPLELLCVGRLVADKGQGVLLDALAALRREGLDVRATFAGDGPERAALEHRAARLGIAADVTFEGHVSQDRLRRLYAAADVFCLPSFAEGVPVVLMEAMAAGLPVVSTRVMGIPELVEDGVSGELVAPGRPDSLAAAIRKLTAEPERRAAFGRAGRARVVAQYDVRTWVAALHRLYVRYLGGTD
ncbi:MAG: glycosyltransferase family 4 protein [Solirubrobacteraceae bacterium]